jgi:hypothetical protein
VKQGFAGFVVLAIALALTVPAGAKTTKPKPPPPAAVGGGKKDGACGMSNLPLAVGNSWTYRATDKVTAKTREVIIKVTEIGKGKDQAGKDATIITVEEQYQGSVLKAQWTCTPAGGLQIAPESMFFAAEPGGGIGMVTTITSREQVTFPPDAGLTNDSRWVERVSADLTRPSVAEANGKEAPVVAAKHKPAHIDIQRHITDVQNENVTVPIADFKNTMKIIFEIRGETTVETEKYPLAGQNEKHPGTYWIVKGLGIVKMQDNFDTEWDLVATSLPVR